MIILRGCRGVVGVVVGVVVAVVAVVVVVVVVPVCCRTLSGDLPATAVAAVSPAASRATTKNADPMRFNFDPL